jgi:Domain of unknown function DUF11
VRPTRIHLAIAMTALGVYGVLWAVCAQGVSQPSIPQPDAPPPEKKTPAKSEVPAQPPRDKPKADPTLISPPEIFDVPHPAAPVSLPALPGLESKSVVTPVIPAPLPEPSKMLIDPLTPDPPRPKKTPESSSPPALAFPAPLGNTPSPAAERTRSFVRLRSAANEIAPTPLDVVAAPPDGGMAHVPPPPPTGNAAPNPNALLNLQSPAVAVEKRGPTTLRAGETQTFQLVLRNLGSVAAQLVRIEEEIPVGAKLVSADPPPQRQGSKAIWLASPLLPGSDLIASFSLQADVALELAASTSVHVSAMQPINTTALRPANAANLPAVHITAPETAIVGTPVRFDVHVANPTGLPLTGVRMFGYLPEGLDTPDGRKIEMVNSVTIAPGSKKNLQMPTNAVIPGRHTVQVKVVSSAGEAWATATIDIVAAALTMRQAEMTRLFPGREGELRIDVTNSTGKPVRNVAVSWLLPEGLDYLDSSDRGLFQANHRTVYWLIDAMPAGQTRALGVRVSGAKAGQYQNIVSARADGIAEIHSTSVVALEGSASLKLRVVDRDNPLELGKDTVYEIQISNGGAAPARNVRLQVQFAPGLVPRSAQGNMRYSVNGQIVTFEPIPSLGPDGPAVYRVSAHAQSAGDQRVRFAVVSDEVQTPIQREISTKVY